MYKPLERKAESLFKKAEKLKAPEWLLDYCYWKIDRAKFFRKCADSESAKQIQGGRSDRFRKAVDAICIAIELLELFIFVTKFPDKQRFDKRPAK